MNFLNLWILSRVAQAATSTLLCCVGAALGLRIVFRWTPGRSCEEQLVMEQQAELIASMVQVALIFEVLGLGLSVLVADHLVGAIRGAMCAFGVLASTRSGFWCLATTALTAVACVQWIVLHRLDLMTEAPLLTRRKLLWLVGVSVLAVCDLALTVGFAYELDLKVIASCCSVWVDETVLRDRAVRWVMSPVAAGGLGLGVVLPALACTLATSRWPQRTGVILTASFLSAAAPFAALPAVLVVVAPHVLETPTHLCPFCLIHSQGGYLGWPLFSAIFTGSVTGLGLGVVELHRSATGNPPPVSTMLRSLGRWSAVSWATALVCGVFPVIRYLYNSGGVSVFGEF